MIYAASIFNLVSFFNPAPYISYAIQKIKRAARFVFGLFSQAKAADPIQAKKAVKVLQRAFCRYLLKKEHKIDEANCPPLYFAIQEIKRSRSSDLQAGHLDAKVQSCLLRAKYSHNSAALQLLAYALFSGERKMHWSRSPSSTALMALFQKEEAKPADLADLLEKAFIEWKKAYLPPPLQKSLPTKRGPWHKKAGLHHNKKIYISHGGGLYFLQDFLRGKNNGYTGDIKTPGLWVTPALTAGGSKEDAYYAVQTPPSHFDLPAVMTAVIQARHLVELPNSREALLCKDAVKYLKNISIHPVPKKEIKQRFWI